VSYAAYLWNYPIILWLNGGSTADLPPLVAVSAIALTLLLALISWHTVERLGRIARERFDRRYSAKDQRDRRDQDQREAGSGPASRQASTGPGRVRSAD
jgi:peptidoglycan/LPS O-acetylase OafA/YrhL